MATYNLEGQNWASTNITWSFATQNLSGQPAGFSSFMSSGVFENEIIAALARWELVANINFLQATDSSNVDIRFGYAQFDGSFGILAETDYYYSRSHFLPDVTVRFDSGEQYTVVGGHPQLSGGVTFEAVALHEIGHALGLDHYDGAAAIMNTFAHSNVRDLTSSDIAGIQALYGAATSSSNHPPVVTAGNVTVGHSVTSVSASSLFTVSDADNNAIVSYRFWDGTPDLSSGHFVVNGAAQGANQYINVTASQLSQASFQVGVVSDQLWVQAYDGIDWGAWAIFTLSHADQLPVVTASNVTLAHGTTSVAVSSLFSVSDAENDTITQYRFWDGTADSASGYFVVSGVAQGANQYVSVSAAQLSQTTFQAGTVADQLWAQAYDGVGWSNWSIFTLNWNNHTPIVAATSPQTLPHALSVAVSSLFKVSDADNDTIVQYRLWDGTADPASGHFVVSGVPQAANQHIDITAALLSQTTFQAGTVGDQLWVEASDGYDWGPWAVFTANPPANTTPVVSAPSTQTLAHGALSIGASSLFSVSDADNDTISQYRFWDGTADSASGHFVVNGIGQGANQYVQVSAAQLSQTTFQAGSVTDQLWVQASDGFNWGAWTVTNLSPGPDATPVVSAGNTSVSFHTAVAASSLFTASDADNDPITKYQFWDTPGTDAHLAVNDQAQPYNQAIEVLANQLNQASFVSGTTAGSDLLYVRAFDGIAWGDWHAFQVTTSQA